MFGFVGEGIRNTFAMGNYRGIFSSVLRGKRVWRVHFKTLRWRWVKNNGEGV